MKKIKKLLMFTMTLTALMLCCLFSFTASAEAGGDLRTARSIKVNAKYTDNISGEADVDYFKFTLPSAGSIYLNFTRENVFDSNEVWIATLYNSKTENITDCSFIGTEMNTNTHKVGLSAGTYYLKITGSELDWRGYSLRYSTVDYGINIKYTKSAYWETENNESYQTATKISLNKKYCGSVSEEYDKDYYKFTLPSSGYIYLNFTRENIFDSADHWIVTLYNANTSFITDYTFSGTDKNTNTHKVGLSAGTYYLKITGSELDWREYSLRYSTVDYGVNIKYTKSAYWETENNESYQTATKISLNQKYSGSISEGNDVDYYKFIVSKKTKISFNFVENVTYDNRVYYQVQILDSNTNLVKDILISANATSIAETMTLNTGAYYIKILGAELDWQGYSCCYSTVPYTFSVSIGTTSKITSTKTTSSVTLNWNKVTGASGYRVFQKVDGKWKTLGDTSKTTCTIKNLKAGTKYSFAVRAYITEGKTKVMAPKYKTISVTTAETLGVTSKLIATQTTSSVTLKWNKVTGATGYRIYTMRKGEWKKLVDTTKLTYTEKKLGSGSMFKYRVKAYTTKNGKTVWATKYKQVETSTKPATSTLKVTSTAKGKATLTWSNPSGESGFEIYYSTKKDSGFKKLATTKANVKKATISKLQSKKTYYFKVRSFKTTQSGKAYSAYSAVKSVKVK